jgi:homoaconitase/3-isopropylmalate dehydratase large subunit
MHHLGGFAVVQGHRVAASVRAMVVPGSQAVKRQAEEEGLHKTRAQLASVRPSYRALNSA